MAFIATHPLCPTIAQRTNSQRMALEAKMGVSAPFPLVGIIGDTDPMTSAPQPIWWVGHCCAVTSVTFLRLLRVATSASLSPLMPLDAVRHRHPFVQLATLVPMPQFLMAAIATEGRADGIGVTRHADAVSPQPVRFVLLRQPLFVFCQHHMGFQPIRAQMRFGQPRLMATLTEAQAQIFPVPLTVALPTKVGVALHVFAVREDEIVPLVPVGALRFALPDSGHFRTR
jgi:hypothetical protein